MKYSISFDVGNFREVSPKFIKKYKNIPYLDYNNRTLWGLKRHYHKWLKEYNISYKIRDYPGKYAFYIDFENKAEAMLFKLTWI